MRGNFIWCLGTRQTPKKKKIDSLKILKLPQNLPSNKEKEKIFSKNPKTYNRIPAPLGST
jgi:hypothetical protein